MSPYIIRLCWKNIWRNKRRTFITVNAIGIGVTALIWLLNYYDAFHEQLVENAIRYHSGHILVTSPGFNESKAPGKYLAKPNAAYRWLSQQKEVKAYSSHILIQGLLSSPRSSTNIFFKGVYPNRERTTTKFSQNIVSGTFFGKTRGKPIVIGKDLAKKLKVRVGSKLVALTQGIDGSIGNELFRVTGIFDTQSQFDKSLVFILAKDARTLLSLPKSSVHQISILLHSDKHIEKVRTNFHKKFSNKKWQAMSWAEVQKNLMGLIELNKGANKIIMLIILFIATMGIANSILMSILERTREFGVMMAMGTTKSEVIKMVVMETFFLSFVGVILGNILGICVTLYFNKTGFDLSWLTDNNLVVNGAIIQMVSYPEVHWYNNLTITVVIVFLSLLASFIPVKHVSKLDPVEALRAT